MWINIYFHWALDKLSCHLLLRFLNKGKISRSREGIGKRLCFLGHLSPLKLKTPLIWIKGDRERFHSWIVSLTKSRSNLLNLNSIKNWVSSFHFLQEQSQRSLQSLIPFLSSLYLWGATQFSTIKLNQIESRWWYQEALNDKALEVESLVLTLFHEHERPLTRGEPLG